MMRIVTICVILLAGCSPSIHEFISTEITPQELQQHVKYLSSDELRGRKSGEEGNRMAASYIAKQFEQYGLKPVGDGGSFFQKFSFVSSSRIGEKNSLSIAVNATTMQYRPEERYRTLSFSADTILRCPLVFVGYGIAAPDSLHYNDYAGIDVTNKIVIALRYSPEGSGENKFQNYSGLVQKSVVAREKGAAGIIFLTSPPGTDGSELKGFLKYYPMANSSIAAIAMNWSDIDSLLRLQGKNLRAIQGTIDSTKSPGSFELSGATVSLQTEIIKVRSESANIVGFLEGSSAPTNTNVLVIGAHMDHLGMGGEGSGSLKPDTVAIHHGADDNASGTAGLLEVAQYLSSHRERLSRSILFIAFTGEELGLYGSDYYVKHPLFPLDQTVAMINMDMIGRMKDSILVVEGMGTSPQWEELAKKENLDSLKLKLKPDGFGPSDHSSFYGKDIPVMFFFTNLHSDYHRPSDTWEKINYHGEQLVVDLVARLAQDISSNPTKPTFTKVVASSSSNTGGDRPGVRVSLGVIPDYAEDVPGLKISGTRAGSAAEKAGLKSNDIIVKFAGKDVKSIYDFMHLLEGRKPGDVVDVVVKRGIEEVQLKATLEARP